MAAHNFYVANPTTADITVDAHTVLAGHAALLSVDDATTDLQGLVEAGCTVASAEKATTLRNNVGLVEAGTTLLLGLVRAVASAGSDAHAQAGL